MSGTHRRVPAAACLEIRVSCNSMCLYTGCAVPQVFLYVKRSLCVWDAVLGCVVVGLDTGFIVSECWYLCSDCSGWFMPMLLSVCLAAAWVHVRAHVLYMLRML